MSKDFFSNLSNYRGHNYIELYKENERFLLNYLAKNYEINKKLKTICAVVEGIFKQNNIYRKYKEYLIKKYTFKSFLFKHPIQSIERVNNIINFDINMDHFGSKNIILINHYGCYPESVLYFSIMLAKSKKSVALAVRESINNIEFETFNYLSKKYMGYGILRTHSEIVSYIQEENYNLIISPDHSNFVKQNKNKLYKFINDVYLNLDYSLELLVKKLNCNVLLIKSYSYKEMKAIITPINNNLIIQEAVREGIVNPMKLRANEWDRIKYFDRIGVYSRNR